MNLLSLTHSTSKPYSCLILTFWKVLLPWGLELNANCLFLQHTTKNFDYMQHHVRKRNGKTVGRKIACFNILVSCCPRFSTYKYLLHKSDPYLEKIVDQIKIFRHRQCKVLRSVHCINDCPNRTVQGNTNCVLRQQPETLRKFFLLRFSWLSGSALSYEDLHPLYKLADYQQFPPFESG